MRTVPLKIEHAHDIAALHIQGINTGFISSLGIDFVTALYEAIAKSTSGFGFALIPETSTFPLLGLGSMMLRRKRRG